MTADQQIQIAADFMDRAFQARGIFSIGKADCLKMARQLYDIWHTDKLNRNLENLDPGEVAVRFRQRYECSADQIDRFTMRLGDGDQVIRTVREQQ